MTTTIINVPLHELVPGAKAPGGSINSRKAEAPVDELAASIITHGLLVPLLVRKIGDAYHVLDGNRRLAALRLIEKNGVVPILDVACVEVREGDALELSAVVNVDRVDLHPVDRFEVFAALVQSGATVEQLAARYQMKAGAVRQALALGRMAPEVREAWRADKIPDEIAEAFTATSDHKVQATVLKRSANIHSAWHVRNEITKGADVGRMLKFVGRAAYEKAGHDVNESLFSEREGLTVSDVGALKGMAARKLSEECDKLTTAGWKWAVPADEAPQDSNAWRRVHKASYAKADMAEMGCIVSVGHDDKIRVERGVVKPGDKVAAPKSPKEKKADHAKRERRMEETGGLSNALAFRLSQQLTAAVREAFATGVGADDLLALVVAALACGDALTPTKVRLGTDADDGRLDNDFTKYYKLALAKKMPDRLNLMAQWLARSIDLTAHHAPSLVKLLHPGKDDDRGARTLVERIGRDEMLKAARKHFDAADYFASVSKEMISQAVQDALGKEHHARVAKMKAPEARAYAIKHVPKTGWVPEALRI